MRNRTCASSDRFGTIKHWCKDGGREEEYKQFVFEVSSWVCNRLKKGAYWVVWGVTGNSANRTMRIINVRASHHIHQIIISLWVYIFVAWAFVAFSFYKKQIKLKFNNKCAISQLLFEC